MDKTRSPPQGTGKHKHENNHESLWDSAKVWKKNWCLWCLSADTFAENDTSLLTDIDIDAAWKIYSPEFVAGDFNAYTTLRVSDQQR